MPKRALIQRRPWLLGSIIAAIAYTLLQTGTAPGLYLVWLKAGAIGMLAAYAALRHPGKAASHLAIMLGLVAAGQVLLDVDGGLAGFVLFAAWLVAMALYMRFPRRILPGSQKMAAASLLLITPLIAWLWAGDASAAYSGLVLGAMAATAWASRFPRYRTGIGTVMVSAHELLGLGRWPESLALLGWPLLYLGLFLIAIGVVQTLRRDHIV